MNAQELSARLVRLSVRIMNLVQALPESAEARHVARQLLRSGTSPGANYEEACGAESRADFAHKLGIVLKELKESRYWIRVIRDAPLVDPKLLGPLLEEVEELIAIFAQSLITLGRGQRGKRDMTSAQ